jgi:hypothetical protein
MESPVVYSAIAGGFGASSLGENPWKIRRRSIEVFARERRTRRRANCREKRIGTSERDSAPHDHRLSVSLGDLLGAVRDRLVGGRARADHGVRGRLLRESRVEDHLASDVRPLDGRDHHAVDDLVDRIRVHAGAQHQLADRDGSEGDRGGLLEQRSRTQERRAETGDDRDALRVLGHSLFCRVLASRQRAGWSSLAIAGGTIWWPLPKSNPCRAVKARRGGAAHQSSRLERAQHGTDSHGGVW